MKRMLKIYLTHPSIHFYMALFITMLWVSIKLDLGKSHALYFLLPIFITPFFEWFAHKLLLHRIIPKTAGFAYKYQQRLHYFHHADPAHQTWIFAPISSALLIFVFVFLLFTFLGWSFKAGLASMTFSMVFFLYYEWVHLGHHMPGYDHLTPYGKFMKKAHQWHHYTNENYWWGITSHIGDLVLKTFPSPKEIPHGQYLRDIGHTGENLLKPLPEK